MKTEVVNKTIELSDNLELMLNCAMRYAMGRRTYIVGTFCDYVKSIMTDLSLITLERMKQDFDDFAEYGNSWGDECDKETWMRFKMDLDETIKKRKEQRCTHTTTSKTPT